MNEAAVINNTVTLVTIMTAVTFLRIGRSWKAGKGCPLEPRGRSVNSKPAPFAESLCGDGSFMCRPRAYAHCLDYKIGQFLSFRQFARADDAHPKRQALQRAHH